VNQIAFPGSDIYGNVSYVQDLFWVFALMAAQPPPCQRRSGICETERPSLGDGYATCCLHALIAATNLRGEELY
jgi:hypothetical protein